MTFRMEQLPHIGFLMVIAVIVITTNDCIIAK